MKPHNWKPTGRVLNIVTDRRCTNCQEVQTMQGPLLWRVVIPGRPGVCEPTKDKAP